MLWGPSRHDPLVADLVGQVQRRILELSRDLLQGGVTLSGRSLEWATTVVGEVLVDFTLAWLDHRDEVDEQGIVA